MFSTNFLKFSAVALVGLEVAEAFSPAAMPLQPALRKGAVSVKVNEDRRDGFGGGQEAIFDVIEKRSKNDWGGSGTGGASGKIHDGPSSFADYMARRAQEAGGKVEVGGVDVTDAKPTQAVGVGAWGAPTGTKVEADPNEWVDKSVSGFDTTAGSFLDEDPEIAAMKAQRDAERAQQESEIEAKMAMWLKQAEEKKAQGQ
mmetsp:Transcript_16235/g.25210  ORF Transcript_16235/g.25210 Transcript_16235/m.25210 type:complete len:200 (+) Transcript_16235:34-633(+)